MEDSSSPEPAPKGSFRLFGEAERRRDPTQPPKLIEKETHHGKDLQACDARR
jgi:hypothetical protein